MTKATPIKFEKNMCKVLDNEVITKMLVAIRRKNIYVIYTNDLDNDYELCLFSAKDECVMWYNRLGHVNAKNLSKITNQNLIFKLPRLTLSKNMVYNACYLGKHVRTPFKFKSVIKMASILQLLHLNLFGSIRMMSFKKKRYGLIIIGDFSRFIWVLFLATKDESFDALKNFAKKM